MAADSRAAEVLPRSPPTPAADPHLQLQGLRGGQESGSSSPARMPAFALHVARSPCPGVKLVEKGAFLARLELLGRDAEIVHMTLIFPTWGATSFSALPGCAGNMMRMKGASLLGNTNLCLWKAEKDMEKNQIFAFDGRSAGPYGRGGAGHKCHYLPKFKQAEFTWLGVLHCQKLP